MMSLAWMQSGLEIGHYLHDGVHGLKIWQVSTKLDDAKSIFKNIFIPFYLLRLKAANNEISNQVTKMIQYKLTGLKGALKYKFKSTQDLKHIKLKKKSRIKQQLGLEQAQQNLLK